MHNINNIRITKKLQITPVNFSPVLLLIALASSKVHLDSQGLIAIRNNLEKRHKRSKNKKKKEDT